MLIQSTQATLNLQYQKELGNHIAYLRLGAGLDYANWPGLAAYMKRAAQEELDHARRLYDHIVDRGGLPLPGIMTPPAAQETDPLDLFEAALELEQGNLISLSELYHAADDAGDVETCAFLTQTDAGWPGFILEQTESIRALTELTARLERATCPAAMELIDRELAGAD